MYFYYVFNVCKGQWSLTVRLKTFIFSSKGFSGIQYIAGGGGTSGGGGGRGSTGGGAGGGSQYIGGYNTGSKYTQEEAGELLLVLPAAYHVLLDIEQEAVEADSAK